jgi:hypothetical protein
VNALVSTLQALVNQDDLYDEIRFPDDSITPETRRLAARRPRGRELRRLNRLLLEDAFGRELAKDFGNRMQIRYLADRGDDLASVLGGTSLEATLLYVDRVLKDLAHGRRLAEGLNVGASEILLCSQELEEWSRSGNPIHEYPRRPYVTFYDLTARLAFDRFEEAGLWFNEPRLVVRADAVDPSLSAPECVRQFAASLTANMGQLLAHRELGQEFRRLRALLLVFRAIGWARHIFVPMNQAALASVLPPQVRNEPPEIRELLMVIGESGLVVRGGVLFLSPDHAFPEAPFPIARTVDSGADGRSGSQARQTSRLPGAQPRSQASQLGLHVSQAAYEPNLLRIDISDILGLARKD